MTLNATWNLFSTEIPARDFNLKIQICFSLQAIILIQTAFKVNSSYNYLNASYELNARIMLISGRNCCGGTRNEP